MGYTVTSFTTDFWVNIVPTLSYVPDWFPGTGWKATARAWRAQKEWTVNSTYQWTKDQVVSHVTPNSWIASTIYFIVQRLC